MNRYDIAMDFKKKFIEQNEKVLRQTVKASFISINGNNVKVSRNPFSMEKAEHGLVIFTYSYIVIEREDDCMVPLFFNSNDEIEDYINLDGWKLYFSKPLTALYRCYNFNCFMTNGLLEISISINPLNLDNEFERIWHLFSIVRTCKTQKEIDFAKKIYQNEKDIQALKETNMRAEAKKEELRMLLDAHKDFIENIKELISGKKNNLEVSVE